MRHPIAVTAQTAVTALHDLVATCVVDPQNGLVDGAYFSWDEERSEISIDLKTDTGMMFDVTASVDGEPRWFSFNIGLGHGAVAPGSVLGLVLDHEGDLPAPLQFFVRSAKGEELQDTTLVDYASATDTRSVVTVLHEVAPDDALCNAHQFHTLIVTLPAKNFAWTLHDLHVFVAPATPDE